MSNVSQWAWQTRPCTDKMLFVCQKGSYCTLSSFCDYPWPVSICENVAGVVSPPNTSCPTRPHLLSLHPLPFLPFLRGGSCLVSYGVCRRTVSFTRDQSRARPSNEFRFISNKISEFGIVNAQTSQRESDLDDSAFHAWPSSWGRIKLQQRTTVFFRRWWRKLKLVFVMVDWIDEYIQYRHLSIWLHDALQIICSAYN